MGRAARKLVVEAESDSDDGAPEEVNMAAGRDEAERIRREERESQKRVLAAAKEKRKKASGPKEGKTKKKQKAELLAAAADEADADQEEELTNQQKASRAVAHGLLDDSIVKFLAAQEKKVVDIDNSLPEKVEPKEQTEKKKKRRKNDSSPSGYTPTSLMTCWNGFKVWLQSQNYWTENVIIDVTGKKNFLCLNFFRRVKVVVLSSIKPKAASFHSAMEFRRNRLFGEDVHRSLVMLPKKVR
ncbi:hypothetical protein AXG93_1217s1540 [Marchantia polymorpha subsp. ruderalis]|uniref:Uncharacterized protein n=1 Tax=Marchantia polymorpha subsp. ruderalis TaxID=1480154 RepID=A0A176VUH2_MARPO|nr:hypothetical protein AXG93_1217s1540 [Marchantia polymorpha subsp. ruderalis]